MTERRLCQGLPASKAEAFNYLDRFSFHFSKEKRILKQLLTELTDVELASGTPRNREYQSKTETLKWVGPLLHGENYQGLVPTVNL